jgi:hypothetical protein
MAFKNGPTLSTKDLIICLDGSDRNSYTGTGTTWIDLSGKKTNGTLVNSPVYSTANGGVFIFDGINEYVDLGYIGDYRTASYTLCAFIYPEFDYLQFGRLIIGKSTSCNIAELGLDYGRTTNKFTFVSRNDLTLTSVNTYTSYKWYYVVLTRSNNGNNTYTSTLYINGTLDTATTVGYAGTGGSANINIGRSPGCSGNGTFLGKISSVAVYNRVLTAGEVLQNYNAQKGRFNLK